METMIQTTAAGSPALALRVLKEGYGPGAWHGPDMKAAVGDVTPELAFWRPGRGRHNIAEVALHHAYYIWSVRTRLSSDAGEPFVLQGDDWFELPDEGTLSWAKIQAIVETEQRRLETLVSDIGAGKVSSPLGDAERFDLVLGITCHAVYHAGQIQMVKRLRDAAAPGEPHR
jgi:hypothetical protein